MIDRHFLKFLKKKVGEKTFNKLPASRTGRGGTIMKFFEGAKRDYGQHSNDDYWLIPVSGVPDDPANGIEDGEIKLTPYVDRNFYLQLKQHSYFLPLFNWIPCL